MLQVLGGLGLFLLGMVVMTDALRQLAGASIARFLARFTRSPLSGVATGAATTALVQSSSVTTLAAVGFVGAGLLSFPQALGIVFGANIGTTLTGWLVALLGIKLEIGTLVLPLIPIGMGLRLFGRGRVAAGGFALAGFGVIFLGIALLQDGMTGFQRFAMPERFPSDDLAGRALLVGVGLAVTLVTQSSSAGVATALAAVHADAISLAQACAIVIGMDVGTTSTALLASLGGSVPARRTAFAHVIYNLLTAVFAFALVGPYLLAIHRFAGGLEASDPEIALVAFHTAFNTLGVVLVLPVAGRFATLVERLVPERPLPFARRLDASLLSDPGVAVGAASATLAELALHGFDAAARLLRREPAPRLGERLDLVALALAETRRYVERASTSADLGDAYLRQVSALHAIDHLDRLVERARRLDPKSLRESEDLADAAAGLRTALDRAVAALGAQDARTSEPELRQMWEHLEERSSRFRADTLARSARGEFGTGAALERLDAFRWLQRMAYHAWRIVHHLERSQFCRARLAPEEMPPHAEPTPPE